MEIVVPPPVQAQWFLVGLPALAVVVALLLRGRPLVHRVLPVLVVSAACAAAWHFALRPMRFAWDREGVRDGTFGEERVIRWADVREARLVRGFWRSDVRPVRRTHGTAYAGWCSGTWQVADGRSLRVFIDPAARDALLVTAAGDTYLWAPGSFDRFVEDVRRGTGKPAGP
ncbi:MAG: PH domain-containing protein [Thermoanaerobaculia bacterium]